MGAEKIHVWVGIFGADGPADYFDETYSDADDEPISQFVGDQGETWVDHDWMERSWLEEAVPVIDLIKRHLLPGEPTRQAENRAEVLGLSSANVLVVIDVDEVASPCTVEEPTHRLVYLGRFDNKPPAFPLEETIAAAEAGDTKAQATLGALYIFPPPELDHIVDIEKAEHWLLRGAAAGHTSTYNRLYHVYAGRYGPAQPEKAFLWIEKAAQRGWGADLGYLAEMYRTGTGTDRDDLKALQWEFLRLCSISSNQRDGRLRELTSRLSQKQVDEAERLALEWIETTGKTAPMFKGFVRNPIRDLSNGES